MKMKTTIICDTEMTPQYVYLVNVGYQRIEAGGLIEVWGRAALEHWRAGGIVLVRLTRKGLNAPLACGDMWAEVACAGADPCDPAAWSRTGKTWPVGYDILQLKREAGIVDCLRGVPRT